MMELLISEVVSRVYIRAIPQNVPCTLSFAWMKQWSSKVAGRCGECGDPWEEDRPRDHETGGKYAKNIIVGRYSPGSDIEVIIDLTSNHLGWFQFSLCPRYDKEDKETNECFDEHILELSDGSGTVFHIPTNRSELQFLRVKLPENLSCDYCVFRWHWRSGNRIGPCDNGEERLGCGPQETYRNCADIAIKW
ncbi:uncharacterized protein LOC143226564 [Tachypleus tridentatus]|uniref:uncharacterized protein LOC143226564 n=1 Tax=Tachypleus tridentatus TaxID=6853 RepID=UPI003FCEEEAE